jgi:hypothetical protein
MLLSVPQAAPEHPAPVTLHVTPSFTAPDDVAKSSILVLGATDALDGETTTNTVEEGVSAILTAAVQATKLEARMSRK